MDYIRVDADGQLTLTQSTEFLFLPSCLYGFHNTETTVETAISGRTVYCFVGTLDIPEVERLCSCGCRMHINTSPEIYLRHINIGRDLSTLKFPHNQLRCPKCGATKSQYISFKADGHLITKILHQYTCDLLASGTYTNKEVAELTGLRLQLIPHPHRGTDLRCAIWLSLMDKPNRLPSEAYTLTVDKKGITIQAPEPEGIFRGIQTLRKSIPAGVKANTVKVLTRHSARGLEFENVAVWAPVWWGGKAMCRVNYVAATRAKKILLWLKEPAKKKVNKKSKYF